MLPNPQDVPAGSLQGSAYEPISPFIAFQLFPPKHAIAGRDRPVIGTTMPKTPIHKNSQPSCGEDEIGLSENARAPAPTFDARDSEEF